MGTRPPSGCRRCGKVAESGTICSKCKPAEQQHVHAKDKYRNDSAEHAFYRTMEWINCSQELRRQNVLCQRIENGVQCRYVAQLSHHLLSPKTHPALRLSPSNLVVLCRFHHPDTEGDPGNLHYIPTKWFREEFSHINSFGLPALPDPTGLTGLDSWLRSMQKAGA